MFIGEANIDGVTSFLFLINGKLGGYKIIDWHRYPLDNKELDELKKLQLSNNNKVIEEGEYKVILDLNSGYKHYFKDDKEDLMMFYQMNGEDYTLYSGKGNNGIRKKIGNIIFNTFLSFTMISLTLGSMVLADEIIQSNRQKASEAIDTTNYVTVYVFNDNEIESFNQDNEILPLTAEEISNYVNSSSRLNDEEKTFLDNELLFTDLLPYVNRNQHLIEKLRQELYEIDIQCEEPGHDWAGYAGYNNGTNTIHVIGYKEELFQEKKRVIAHEFSHDFQCTSKEFNYLREASNDLIASEYFKDITPSSGKDVKIVKCLMEIIGVEPILESHICNNPSLLFDSLSPYLTEEEISLFSIDKRLFDYTEDEKDARYEALKNVLEKLYYGMYGESMWDNAMINAIFNDFEYERYYFNSEKIKNTEMYACTFDEEEYSIEEAIQEGYIHPYLWQVKKVSLEEWLEYDGPKNIGGYTCKVPYERTISETNCIRVINEDGTTTDIPIKEAVESGIMTIDYNNLSITVSIPTTDLDNKYIQYEMEENVVMDGDKVIVTKYKKEYFSPIQENINVLN